MKVTSILTGTITALLTSVVFAAAEEEQKVPDYVIKTVVDAYNAQPAENKHELIKRASCARNNCLRALAARTNLARHFCASYTNTIAATVGVFSQQCHSPSKLSSACSCEWPATTTTTTTTTAAPPTTPSGPNCISSGHGCQVNQPCCSPYGCVVTTIHGIGTCGPAPTSS
ncbi:hypothetical protein QBC37DRAFT_391389 [Rhypophila decipiens]|uniref:Uncharacterized protein n=1 Tax=Rhypophila decipiens TaxID=261697 RepID=A0AAN7B5W1_9PEZI|nr:hypothetical protein QBC37DRAFT_391389 [Rhypophila decipiens]